MTIKLGLRYSKKTKFHRRWYSKRLYWLKPVRKSSRENYSRVRIWQRCDVEKPEIFWKVFNNSWCVYDVIAFHSILDLSLIKNYYYSSELWISVLSVGDENIKSCTGFKTLVYTTRSLNLYGLIEWFLEWDV